MKNILRFSGIGLTIFLCLVYLGIDQPMLDTTRPFLYRQFVPTFAWALQKLFSLDTYMANKIIIFLSSIGMAWSTRWLYTGIYPENIKADMFVILNSCIVFFLAIYPIHIYDIPTVFLFTLSMAFLKRELLIDFLLLFPIVCLNRETAFLLTILFGLHYWGKLSPKKVLFLMLLQGVTLLFVQGSIHWLLRSFPWGAGDIGWNVMSHALITNIEMMYAHFIVGILLLSLISAKWTMTPTFLRYIIISFLPMLTILYWTLGYPFEWRVFLEIVPVLVMIGIQ